MAAVKLGAMVYRRYLNLLPRDAVAPETVYALPTTTGAVVASCVAPTTNATAGDCWSLPALAGCSRAWTR